jgi:hypothetical protein
MQKLNFGFKAIPALFKQDRHFHKNKIILNLFNLILIQLLLQLLLPLLLKDLRIFNFSPDNLFYHQELPNN